MSAAVVTLPNGAQVTSDMTPLERHNAVAASMNLPTAPKPSGIVFGPQGHTDATAMRLAQGDGKVAELLNTPAAKAPPPSTASKVPPSPAELEASRAAKIAAFDAEMVAEGKQIARTADGRYATVEKAIEARLASYKALKPEQRTDTARQQLERDLAPLYTQLQEAQPGNDAPADRSRAVAAARNPANTPDWSEPQKNGHGRVLTDAGRYLIEDLQKEFKALPAEQRKDSATVDAYNIGIMHVYANEHGNVSVEHFHPDMLHGYTLPRFLPDQHYSPGIINSLASARAAGFTQQQVDAFIRADMVKNGWLKA